MMASKDKNSNISVYRYWKQMALIPTIVASIIVCVVALASLYCINRRFQLEELKKIAEIVSESIYDKIDSSALEELSRIVYDIGKYHDVIIIINSPNDETVASYPAVMGMIDRSLPFDLTYKQPIKLQDGAVLGRVIIKKTKQLMMGFHDITWLVSMILLVFIGSSLWQLKFSKPMVKDIFNLSLHDREKNDFRFKEIRDAYSLLKKQNKDLNDMAAQAAIAKMTQMTQMIAHDMRRPFTMLEGILSLITSSNEQPSQSVEAAHQYLPEVRKALMTVNGMLSDIMEAGSETAPVLKKQISVESIIECSLNECFKYNETAIIEFSYQFKHQHMLSVDTLKIVRVINNIVNNAAQAMKNKGRIWFHTNEIDRTIRITIGNINSYIPDKEKALLFEAFYTKNKDRGTGLGLAIARKIITEHGGDIFCHSSKEHGTEFVFTLPIETISKSWDKVKLPTNSAEIRNAHRQTAQKDNPLINDIELEQKILSTGQDIHILIADDESLYRDALKKQIKNSAVGKRVRLTFAKSGEDAVVRAHRTNPDIIIMDVDFGGYGSMNGFQAAYQIRAKGNRSKICIHSNRGMFEFQDTAAKSGCNLFMPKPMTRSHMLAIIAGSLSKPSHRDYKKKDRILRQTPDLSPLFSEFWSNNA